MTKLLILLALPEKERIKYYDGIRARVPGVEVNIVDHNSKVDPYIGEADVLVTFGPMMAEHVLEKAAHLKWIQALGSGVDGITDRAALREGVVVTSLRGIHGPPVSEAAFMSMLALGRGLLRTVRNQIAHKWERFPATLLKGKTAAIFGVGIIAEELALKCKAFGMRVVGVSSTRNDVPGFDRMVPREQLTDAVREADYFILLTPYSPATHGSVNAKVIAAMKPTAFLVNLARGGVVDEDAMIDALQNKRIAGAALDVFSTEPLPKESPLWDMENVLITTHQGGFNDEYADAALPIVEHNLQKFLSGDIAGMTNLVRR